MFCYLVMRKYLTKPYVGAGNENDKNKRNQVSFFACMYTPFFKKNWHDKQITFRYSKRHKISVRSLFLSPEKLSFNK